MFLRQPLLTIFITLILFLPKPVYIDMGRGSANPVVLSVVSNGERVTRKWKIKINMIPCNNLDMGKELSLGESRGHIRTRAHHANRFESSFQSNP